MRRIHSLDYLKTFLALFVVLAHTNWIQNNMSTGLFVFGNGLMRMLVPLFCIIAGYFLHISIARGKTGKWLWRVMALYLFWMAAYFPIWKGQVTSPWSLATTLLWGFFHLWFLIGLFFGGLAVVIADRIGRLLAPRRAVWFVVVPAILCALAGIAMHYADLTELARIPVQRYRNGIFMCFPFVAIGYLVSRHVAIRGQAGLPSRRQMLPLAMLGLCLLVFEAFVVQWRLGTDVMIEVPAATYLAVPAIFLLALQVEMPPQPVDLGLVSASIYFLHIWCFRLAAYLDVHHLFALMAFGIVLPTLIALIYGAVVSRMRGAGRRGGIAAIEPAPVKVLKPRA